MSAEARQALIDSPKTVFQNETAMHADLLNDADNGGTHTNLIAGLSWLIFRTRQRLANAESAIPGRSQTGSVGVTVRPCRS